jgi:hypothetical protein
MKVSELPYRRVTREEMTAGLRHVIERVRGARNVEEILETRAEYLSLKTEYDTAQSLSYMRYTINTVDPFYLAEKDYYDEIGPEIENLDLQYACAVLDNPFRAELAQALSPILLRSMELQRRSMSPVRRYGYGHDRRPCDARARRIEDDRRRGRGSVEQPDVVAHDRRLPRHGRAHQCAVP